MADHTMTAQTNNSRRDSYQVESSFEHDHAEKAGYAPAAATLIPDPTRDHFTDELTITTLRAGAVLIVLFQTAYLFLDLGLQSGLNVATLPLHLANISVGVIGFFMALTPFGRRHWRILALGAISVLLLSTTALSVMAHRNEPYYLSLVLMVSGAAALLPWESRWQASLNGVTLATMVFQSLQVHDGLFEMHWLAGLIAIGLAQSCTVISEAYRRGIGKARTEALEASEAKSGFLSSMSHEIRTPMNAIVGLAEVLRETPLTGEQRRYVDTMFANGRSLLELINNILDLAKIESGRLSTVVEEFDVTELMEQIAESLALRAHEKDLELTVWIDPEVPARVIGDPMRLRQIIVNLLGNAIKFTEFGEVSLQVEKVSLSAEATEVSFTISDTGIGIPDEKIDSVFQVFTQIDSSASRRHDGSGLGLTIVNRLLELLNGKLTVHSQILKGSSFRATVPFKLPAKALNTTPSNPDLKGARVLIAEDNATNRAILVSLIQSAGATVEHYASETEALAAVNAFPPGRFSMLLVDSKMSGVGGFELARKVRERNDSTPILLMLNSDELSSRSDRMKEFTRTSYVVKPVKRPELFRSVNELLATPSTSSVQSPSDNQKTSASGLVRDRSAEPMTGTARILLAEDNPGNRMLVKAYLKGAPFEIEVAENGAVAINKFQSEPYALVLMDMYMPIVNGYEAVAAIRKWEKEQNLSRTPIIALTAAALSGDMQRSLDAGCDFHLTKPVSKATLLDLMHTVLQERASEPPDRSDQEQSSPRPAETAAQPPPELQAATVSVATPKPKSGLSDLNDPALVAEISDLFVTEMGRLMVTLNRAFESADHKTLGDAAHALKGSAAMVGASEIQQICIQLEAANRAQAMDQIKDVLSRLEAAEPRARAEFGKRDEVAAA